MTSFLLILVPLVAFTGTTISFLSAVLKEPPIVRETNQSTNSSILGSSGENIIWFIQISDLHISEYYDLRRVDDLLNFIDEALPVINPAAAVITGDLTDAKFPDLGGSGQSEKEWIMYRKAVEEGRKQTVWLDIRGNHDNFDVPSHGSPRDYYTRYSEQGSQGNTGHYSTVVTRNGVRLAFIAVDATAQPGLRRPFNFIGRLTGGDMTELEEKAEEAERAADYSVWFGHYPTSSIVSTAAGVREVARSGLVYLCGHLHTIYGLMPDMFAVHSSGLREAELGDWKDGRAWRLLAVDHGHLSYTDLKHGQWPALTVTWPPRSGREIRTGSSTHIRLLLFSISPVQSVEISIDGESVGFAERLGQDSPLHTLPWSQERFPHTHHMKIMVNLADGSVKEFQHSFSVSGEGYSSLTVLGRLVLLLDLTTVFQFLFFLMFSASTIPLVLCRSALGRHLPTPPNPLLRRFYLLCSLDTFYLPLAIFPLYLTVGPLCLGEVVSGEYGGIFTWGILYHGPEGLQYLPTSTTWLYSAVHLATVHIPAVVFLANLLPSRYSKLHECRRGSTLLDLLLTQLPMLLLTLFQVYMVYAMYLAYSLPSLIGPMRVGSLVLTSWLWARSFTLDKRDFEKYSSSVHLVKKRNK